MRAGIEAFQLPEIPLQPHQPLSAGADSGTLRYPQVLGPAEDLVVALLVQLEEDSTAVAAVHDAETPAFRLRGDADESAESFIA